MPKTKRGPDYESRSARAQELADETETAAFKQAQDLIDSLLVESVTVLGAMLKRKSDKTKMDAIKQIHKVGGLEIKRLEHSGEIIITDPHADRIRRAAELA